MVTDQFTEMQLAIWVVLQKIMHQSLGFNISLSIRCHDVLCMCSSFKARCVNFFGLFTNVEATNISFSSDAEVLGCQDFEHYILTLKFQIYPLCDNLLFVKVEEYESLLVKLQAHASHFPTSNTALAFIHFGFYCNCLP